MKKIILFLQLNALLISAGLAQSGAINGQVLDENKLGMPGAAIFIAETSQGTITDSRGNFELYNVKSGEYNLTISYLGYEQVTKTVQVSDNKTASITASLEPGVILGDEILILGDRMKGRPRH